MSDKLEYDAPIASEEVKEIAKALTAGTTVNLEEKTKYTVALELFKKDLLPMITELNKEQVEVMTRHKTLIASAKLLFDLPDNETVGIFDVIETMHNEFRLNQVSKARKSRTEIVNILKNEAQELTRSISDKLGGKR